MIRLTIIFLNFFLIMKINAAEIVGFQKIIDGDTLNINSYKIRLEGIDAPEIKQKCKKIYLNIMFLNFQKNYYCGVISKKKLTKKINNKSVKCILSGKDRYKRYLGKCFLKKTNLNRWMVRNGYALAYRKYSKMYVFDENSAKEEKLGIWRGSFIKPEKWRKLN